MAAVVLTLSPVAGRASSGPSCPWVGEAAPTSVRVQQLLDRMTLEDEIALVHGITSPPSQLGLPGAPPYVGVVAANPRLCIPEMNLEDGPAGVGDHMTGVTQLPAPVALAATWDLARATAYGAAIGEEMRGKGVDVALAPTVNIVRDPRWGRAFESLGEDPYLTSQIGVADIRGIQSTGTMAQVKHFAAYNQEFYRETALDDAIVSERTLHEIYFPAFEAAVTDAGVASVMCSYNYVNHFDACENPYLLTQVLKGEMGFGGFVTSDWFAMHSSARSADAGLDMQMPDRCYFDTQLLANVRSGLVTRARLVDMVRRILTEMVSYGMFDRAPSGSPTAVVTTAAHATLAREIAEDGTVLLKNAGGILPIDVLRVHSIAVIGADAGAGAQTGGGGSASVVAPYVSRPADAIAQRAGPHVRVAYDDGTNPATAAAAASRADVAIVFGSLAESEGSDLRRIGLSGAQNQLIEAVARVNPRTIVVLNSGSAVAMPWIKGVAGVIEAWYPGQEDGDAIAAVLFGDVDPSGRLPVTFPSSLFQVPASTPTRYPGVAGVQYSEGDLVGYRWYDANDLHPLFPFGFGLSYTSFRLGGLTVPSTTLDGDVDVSATVTNTGRRAGSEVVQLYLGDPPATGEPVRQLKGFAKVALAPGATQTVHMTLDVRALSWWDPAQRRWVASPGRYDVYVGTSSRSLPLRGSFTLAQQIVSGVPTPTAAPSLPGLQPTVADWTACRADFVAPFVGGTSSITGILP